jgi:2-dehydropantoate 2-reductase
LKVSVIGGGAVGLGLSSCLLAAGELVQLLVRSAKAAELLRHEGLVRTGIFGEVSAPPGSFEVATRLRDLLDFGPDVILVCTKTPARDEVATALADVFPRLSGPPAVVLCLNGWGSAERFALRIPQEHVFSATVTTGFRRDRANRVEITVHGDDIHMGSLFGVPERPVVPICEAISRGGIPCTPSPSMERDVWAKLLYNCALNPLAALLGVPYGALSENPATREILAATVREIFGVLQASGRETHWETADEYLAFFFADLLPPTKEHESSMLQDLRAGRATEIDALCGAISQLASECGAQAPVNDALATLVRALHPEPR